MKKLLLITIATLSFLSSAQAMESMRLNFLDSFVTCDSMPEAEKAMDELKRRVTDQCKNSTNLGDLSELWFYIQHYTSYTFLCSNSSNRYTAAQHFIIDNLVKKIADGLFNLNNPDTFDLGVFAKKLKNNDSVIKSGLGQELFDYVSSHFKVFKNKRIAASAFLALIRGFYKHFRSSPREVEYFVDRTWQVYRILSIRLNFFELFQRIFRAAPDTFKYYYSAVSPIEGWEGIPRDRQLTLLANGLKMI